MLGAFPVRRPKDTAKMEISRHHTSSGAQNCADLFPTAWWGNRVLSSGISCCGLVVSGKGFHQIGLGVGEVVCSVESACAAGNIPQMVEAVCPQASCWTKTFWTKMHGSSLGGCGANAGLCENSRCNLTRLERAREWERASGKSRGRGVGSSAMRASSFLMVSSPKGGLLE